MLLAAHTDHHTLADRVFETLCVAIVQGDIPPGSKISEPELARIYGISRGPLREAIGRLEACGLVVRRPNVGARVVSLSSEQLLEIFHVREALEGMAARLAAENMTAAEIDELRADLVDTEGRLEAARMALAGVVEEVEKTGRSFRIERVAGGLQMLTMPAYAEDITRLKGARQSSKLSQAALETLAIIAYRQPILRADLIIVDDLGLLPVSADAAEGLYRLIDAAYEKRSLAISSNLHPSGFNEIMDNTIAAPLVDRLLHHAHLIVTEGDSYRLTDALNGKGVTPLT